MTSPNILHIPEDNIDPSLIRKAADILIGGGIVAFPTETVYGVGCLMSNEKAIERIYSIKGRAGEKPLAVYLPDNRSLRAATTNRTPAADKLISSFLPGPLTLILHNSEGVPTGYRVSPNTVLKAVLQLLPEPIVGTSANKSGEKDPTTVEQVKNAIGDSIDAIIDSGPRTDPTPSTVVDCTAKTPLILREGRIPSEQIQLALK